MKIYTTAYFRKKLKKIPVNIKKKMIRREQIFITNPFYPILDTHKLHGKLKEELSYSIDDSYRIKFVFIENGDVLYTDVGTHNEVY
jgi:mRNA-degrading endonuclease YafQ of YafQ-DinJ toxin-antitoxin module